MTAAIAEHQTTEQVARENGERPYYLDISAFNKNEDRPKGGYPGRRPTWNNPYLSDVLPADTVAEIERCSRSWESRLHEETQERKLRINDYCHERMYCGVCAPSEAHKRAATWQEHFSAAAKALGLSVPALYFVLTMPVDLSKLIAVREDRKSIMAALFVGVHNVFKAAGLAGWVAAVHFVSSKSPDQPHVHFPVFALPMTKDGREVPFFVKDNAFADRRRLFLGLWNRELRRVCARFDLGEHPSENIKVGYLTRKSLKRMLHYELRAPMQDAFIHGKESAMKTRAAVELMSSFLHPPGSKQAFRRIRGGGCFAPKNIGGFFDGLGLERQDKEPEDGWISEGMAFLIGADKDKATFLIVNTGEIVEVDTAHICMSSGGCSFEWVPKGEKD